MQFWALHPFPLVNAGDDVGALIAEALPASGCQLRDGYCVVVAQKVVSKALGDVVSLRSVVPGPEARRLSNEAGMDPRHVEIILRESTHVLRVLNGHLVTMHNLGFPALNGGVDRSNVSRDPDLVCLLPKAPDDAATAIRRRLLQRTNAEVSVIISDSFARRGRLGSLGLSIGFAGLVAVERRPLPDLFGRVSASGRAVTDGLAAAADVLMGAAGEGTPVVIVAGVAFTPSGDARLGDLLIPEDD
jgi:coenzyme F420-0:L-glutamate ligase/coenzyme F420-1:gamma-L-glutamate ligase